MKRKLFGGMLFILVLASVHQADAKEGFYLGGALLYNSINGDFDGTNGPKTDSGAGIGLVLGYGFTPGLSLEVDWNATGHTAEILSGATPSDAGFGALILALKYNFLSDQPVQPFIRGGIGGYAFVIEDPSGDLKLTGSGFDFGVGADYYAGPHFSIGAGVSRRLIDYKKIEFQGTKANLSPKMSGDATSFDVDFVYHF